MFFSACSLLTSISWVYYVWKTLWYFSFACKKFKMLPFEVYLIFVCFAIEAVLTAIRSDIAKMGATTPPNFVRQGAKGNWDNKTVHKFPSFQRVLSQVLIWFCARNWILPCELRLSCWSPFCKLGRRGVEGKGRGFHAHIESSARQLL